MPGSNCGDHAGSESRPDDADSHHMWWLNAGVAPVYREYWLAVQLHSPNGSAAVRVPADVRRWLPGDAVFDGTV